MTAIFFTRPDEEPAYLAWQESHPAGVVLNTRKTPSASYLVLHSVGSTCLRQQNPTLRYSKLCGHRDEITSYLVTHLGLTPDNIRQCSRCFDRN